MSASEAITCEPLGRNTYRLAPYPLNADKLCFDVPCRRMSRRTFPSEEFFRREYELTPTEYLTVKLVR